MKLNLEFSGGLELLFNNQRQLQVDYQQDNAVIRDLLPWMRDTLLSSSPELFMIEDSVRPGILVLINDADWELEDGLDYELKDGDKLVFISTLHGG